MGVVHAAPNKKELTQKFYSDVQKEYKRLKGKKKMGIPFYSEAYILALLAEKFYRSPKTIENILYGRV